MWVACQPAPGGDDGGEAASGGSASSGVGGAVSGAAGVAWAGTGSSTGGSGAPSGGTGAGMPPSGGMGGAAPCDGVFCGGVCVDLQSNPNHCGACSAVCTQPAVCSMGECRSTCVDGLLQCGQACVPHDTDPNNCGTCGNVCAPGQNCRGGTCVQGSGGTGGSGAGGAAGSSSGGTGGGSGGGPVMACGKSIGVNPTPFGCELAWGANGNTNNRSSYLDFITAWVGYEANGGLGGACDGCNLARQLASTNARAVYYAYFIGYQARESGYGDCNTDRDQNLCTHGASWIKANRQRVVDMYANYARLTSAASPNKGVIWLLEGDFIQYTYADQTSPLTMAELGTLTMDIVCAIKTNQPNAAVALNHSTWIRNPQMSSYFNAMRDSGALAALDLVWTTGMGNVSGGYFNDGDARNRNDGTYAYLSMLTGKRILADTSFGVTAMNDSWTGIPVATLNQRIADGVIAVNVTEPPSDYQTRVANLGPELSSVCR